MENYKSKERVLGLDIGVSSVGFSLVENGEVKEKGVFLFNAPIEDKNTSYKKVRGIQRRARRRLYNLKKRRSKILCLFAKYMLESEDKSCFVKELSKLINLKNPSSSSELLELDGKSKLFVKNCLKKYFHLSQTQSDIWELRDRAITGEINEVELFRILYYISRHRGFSFGDLEIEDDDEEKSDKDEAAKERSKLKAAISELERKIGDLTVGQYFYSKKKKLDEQIKKIENECKIYSKGKRETEINKKTSELKKNIEEKESPFLRNKGGSYTNAISRQLLLKEVNKIKDKQSHLPFINKIDDFIEIAFNDNFKPSSIDKVGDCPLEGSQKEESQKLGALKVIEGKRASKISYQFDLYRVLTKILNIKINNSFKDFEDYFEKNKSDLSEKELSKIKETIQKYHNKNKEIEKFLENIKAKKGNVSSFLLQDQDEKQLKESLKEIDGQKDYLINYLAGKKFREALEKQAESERFAYILNYISDEQYKKFSEIKKDHFPKKNNSMRFLNSEEKRELFKELKNKNGRLSINDIKKLFVVDKVNYKEESEDGKIEKEELEKSKGTKGFLVLENVSEFKKFLKDNDFKKEVADRDIEKILDVISHPVNSFYNKTEVEDEIKKYGKELYPKLDIKVDLIKIIVEKRGVLKGTYNTKEHASFSLRALKKINDAILSSWENNEEDKTSLRDFILSIDEPKYQNYYKDTRENKRNPLLYIPKKDFEKEYFYSNPVVEKTIRKVMSRVNHIITNHGELDRIVLEFANDFPKAPKEKKSKDKFIKENEEFNNKAKKILIENGMVINTANLEKVKLYLEQDGKCIYSGKKIDDLKECQTDHIIPQSSLLYNAFENKVLVLTKENQNKKERFAYEYMKSKGDSELKAYEKRVEKIYSGKKNSRKRANLLLHSLTDKEIEEKDSQKLLNDTRYIIKEIANLIEHSLKFKESDRKRNVFTIKGGLTDKVRKAILTDEEDKKDRAMHYHHIIDAVIISVLGEGEKSRITYYYKLFEGILRKYSKYQNLGKEYAKKRLSFVKDELLKTMSKDGIEKKFEDFFEKQLKESNKERKNSFEKDSVYKFKEIELEDFYPYKNYKENSFISYKNLEEFFKSLKTKKEKTDEENESNESNEQIKEFDKKLKQWEEKSQKDFLNEINDIKIEDDPVYFRKQNDSKDKNSYYDEMSDVEKRVLEMVNGSSVKDVCSAIVKSVLDESKNLWKLELLKSELKDINDSRDNQNYIYNQEKNNTAAFHEDTFHGKYILASGEEKGKTGFKFKMKDGKKVETLEEKNNPKFPIVRGTHSPYGDGKKRISIRTLLCSLKDKSYEDIESSLKKQMFLDDEHNKSIALDKTAFVKNKRSEKILNAILQNIKDCNYNLEEAATKPITLESRRNSKSYFRKVSKITLYPEDPSFSYAISGENKNKFYGTLFFKKDKGYELIPIRINEMFLLKRGLMDYKSFLQSKGIPNLNEDDIYFNNQDILLETNKTETLKKRLEGSYLNGKKTIFWQEEEDKYIIKGIFNTGGGDHGVRIKSSFSKSIYEEEGERTKKGEKEIKTIPHNYIEVSKGDIQKIDKK